MSPPSSFVGRFYSPGPVESGVVPSGEPSTLGDLVVRRHHDDSEGRFDFWTSVDGKPFLSCK